MITRCGKIARLPRVIRHQLNTRLQNGRRAAPLLKWLNALPEVRRVMKEQFGGRLISEQNLSQWRQGGFAEWMRQQEALDYVNRLGERGRELSDDLPRGFGLSDRLATVLTAQLAMTAECLLEDAADPEERFRRLERILGQLRELRREDRKAARLEMDRERWDLELDRVEREKESRLRREARSCASAPIWAAARMAQHQKVFGSDERGRRIAAFLAELQYDLPQGSLHQKLEPRKDEDRPSSESCPHKASQTQSKQIKPS